MIASPPAPDLAMARELLQRHFGYDNFRSHQAEVITTLLNGEDALVLMPTGGGKSLCYQLPSLLRDGVGVVISPLIALMQDQVDALRQNGIAAAYLNSTLNSREVYEIEQALQQGALDLLYIAPERLAHPAMLNLLKRIKLALFAIDEAHCVSQWGHDFRPEYLQLSLLHQQFPEVPRVALTATADTPTRREIINKLALNDAKQFISSFDRPNIRYRIMESQGDSKEQLLYFILHEHRHNAGIVYCLSRKRVEEVAAWLSQKGLTALPYHAALPAAERLRNQQRFLREEGIIIVATIAFGMGIDKPDVRFVAHLNLPKSVESYYQETGRAGRDGAPSDAWMSYGLRDVITLRQMQSQSTANEQHKRVEQHKLDAMLGLCEAIQCRRQILLRYFDDPLPEPCGNCDNCLEPPQSWDATVAARKALSCVYRSGQRYGVHHLIDILLGSSNAHILRKNHQQLSTYGIGKELGQNEWRNLFRQLIAHGLLVVDIEGHGGLCLTEASRPLLRGETTLTLRQLTAQRRGATPSAKQNRRSQSLTALQRPLWEALRELRKSLAERQGIPAFTIFHDATLMEMVQRHPTTLQQLSTISGIGETKLNRYGGLFLELLTSHAESIRGLPAHLSDPNSRPEAGSDTAEVSIRMFQDGNPVANIARQRQMKDATIYSHLCRGISEGILEVQAVTGLSDAELNKIHQTMELYDGEKRLKPIFEALEERYSYELLRCVAAAREPYHD
ncbi:MAG: DNA helicase RecQ [Gammaproteobacteria bacterium]|nr:DNA helicase RecQ [Gammaproteobacteria bacterium]